MALITFKVFFGANDIGTIILILIKCFEADLVSVVTNALMDNITSRPQISSLPGRWAQLWVCVCTPSTVGVTRFCAATPRLVSAEPPS